MGIYPAVILWLHSRILDRALWRGAYNVAQQVKQIFSGTRTSGRLAILGIDELSDDDKLTWRAPQGQKFLSQPSTSRAVYRLQGRVVSRLTPSAASRRSSTQADDVPNRLLHEGSIEKVLEHAEQLKKVAELRQAGTSSNRDRHSDRLVVREQVTKPSAGRKRLPGLAARPLPLLAELGTGD